MKISTSILGIKDELEKKIKILEKSDTDLIHLDIMDNVFVNNYSDFSKLKINKNIDVHLMVQSVLSYVDLYSNLDPEYITFHYETGNVIDKINYIKQKNIKVGLSIKPNTAVEEILPYLDKVDLILVMSVEPGLGGQKFLPIAIDKVNQLVKLRYENNYKYLIEVDGGINPETARDLSADILVVGSFITNAQDYQKKINEMRIK